MKRSIFLVLFLLLPNPIFAYSDFVTAQSYLLIDKDSLQIIEGKDFEKRLPPASTTKVVTALIALDRLSGNEFITPPRDILSIPPSKMGLRPGKKYRAIDLIKGMLIKSANDAAYAIACHIGGNEEGFSELMNEKVREIGARNSNFKNASGLYDPDQYTTCYDLALIFRYALKSHRFREILSTRYFDFKDGKRVVRFQNHDRFLFCFGPAIGGKTGFTRASRHSYVGAFEKDGKIYILSMLGSEDLWGDALCILRNLFEEVPKNKEIENAKAKDVMLTSYKKKKAKAGNISKRKIR
jgi:D-alanyl-D-alanine carboxypeptidase (penicillin-binding protein 5/6)